MSLYLLEYPLNVASREEVHPLLGRIKDAAAASGGELIESQITGNLQRAFVVVEHSDEAALSAALAKQDASPSSLVQVRLVGATLDEVKAARGNVDYLVEWDFPAGLAMDTYLERKKAKSPLYAQVPEVRFLRTYVCEDMSKCLCFYLAHDEAAVRRARDVVSTPITRLHRLAEAEGDAGATEPQPIAAGA